MAQGHSQSEVDNSSLESGPPALAIMGPTGTGKTDVAVELVSQYPFEIISVDSAMVYRELNIGTAKPETEILEKAPHRLIDIISPEAVYSAAEFRTDALQEMQAITDSGKIPLLVGGTGLYFRALFEGISELPSADPQVRQRLELEAEKYGWQALHDRLASIDPQSARRIHPNDPQRISRALEIYELTGKAMSGLLNNRASDSACPYQLTSIILEPEDRSWLHKRLAQRFDLMLEQGLVNEVKGLIDRYDLDARSPSMRLVGYRQVFQHLTDELDQEQMVEKAVVATRQLAKRQMTWFRSDKAAIRVPVDANSPLHEILQIVNKVQLFLS